ncbi:hypothetical protein [Sphingomonas aerophila]|uniref:Putative low-complexity protein n=1 Tax=Sphingomonas aerophila TaxID=1344948 RepID=A0A7W9EU41_9SPHN|nr:hypothetical protein [Sphingomonas aerophila]MBB5714755.1 putative low-complexity protein [Sphingomonas aerophila]
MIKSISAALAGAALIAAPTMAAAAPANPAASLSVAKSVRASAPAGKDKIAGGAGGIAAVLIAAGIAAIGVIAIVQSSDDDSDSN